MSFFVTLLTAVALSMDAFAVSVSCGLDRNILQRYTILYPLSFGFFQGLMPLIGYYSINYFSVYIKQFDHWIAFLLLSFIGGKMLYESIRSQKDADSCEVSESNKNSFAKLIVLSIATSIDALAAGISFALLEINIWQTILMISITTFLFSLVGIKFGKFLGSKSERLAGILGGLILIGIGIKILAEHLLQLGS